MVAIGRAGGVFYTVVYTDRDGLKADRHRLAVQPEGKGQMAATVRMTLAEALAQPSTVDRATIEATTEAEIAAYQAEDGMAGVDDLLDTERLVLPPCASGSA